MPVTADLVTLLDLEPAGPDKFTGHSLKNGWKRIFGGQVLAQSLVAAQRTVPERAVHSLHAYFLLAGDPHEPIAFEVERMRDGRSFSTRRVVARQKGEAIFVLSASFQIEEAGPEHYLPPPSVPSPEDSFFSAKALAALPDVARDQVNRMLSRIAPIETRLTDLSRFGSGRVAATEPRQTLWIRIASGLPDDPALHRAALLYLSDMTLLDTALAPHGHTIFDGQHQVASLDHACWFHRPVRADTWLLYVQDSPNAGGARGLTRGLLYSEAGILVASVAQEGLIRPIRAKS
jgi:acyl-CoA thioesterase II